MACTIYSVRFLGSLFLFFTEMRFAHRSVEIVKILKRDLSGQWLVLFCFFLFLRYRARYSNVLEMKMGCARVKF